MIHTFVVLTCKKKQIMIQLKMKTPCELKNQQNILALLLYMKRKDVRFGHISTLQGRRRVLKSGAAIERHRRSARAEGTSRGRAREGDELPSRKGFGGSPPRKFLNLRCL